MPLRVVQFNPPSEEEQFRSILAVAETSRDIIDLGRAYQWGKGRGGRWGKQVQAAAKKRALQLRFRASELEADQRGILRRNAMRRGAAREVWENSGSVLMDPYRGGFLVQWQPKIANLTDRAQRYRANAEPPAGPKICLFCGTRKNLMVGHLNGHESDNSPDNLHWTCRSCNSLHANALKRARMGRRTVQFNPTASGGASNVGEWMNAVGAIRPHRYPDKNAGLVSTMKVSDAVAMIRATPAHKRSEFASKLVSRRGRSSYSSELPF